MSFERVRFQTEFGAEEMVKANDVVVQVSGKIESCHDHPLGFCFDR
jgi:hypothetical protein